MNQWKRRVMLFAGVFFMLSGTGCRLQREIDVTSRNMENSVSESDTGSEKSANIVHIGREEMDAAEIASVLYGIPKESVNQYRIRTRDEYLAELGVDISDASDGYYVKDDIVLTVSRDGMTGDVGIEYLDNRAAAAQCYYSYISPLGNDFQDGLSMKLRECYPETELQDNVSSETALEKCREAAEACGYVHADISVYAMRLEDLQNTEKQIDTYLNVQCGAPDPAYMPVSQEDQWELQKKIYEAQNSEDTKLQNDLQNQLEELQEKSDDISYIPWEQKDEAYLLIYRPVLDGLVIDSTEQMLRIVYVPFTDTIVYLQGTAPFTIQKKQNTALISRNQAVSTALMELGVEDSAQFAAEKMTLVYAVRAVQIQGADPTIDPCWRIDYVRKDRQSDNTSTIYIDAVTGMVSHDSVF